MKLCVRKGQVSLEFIMFVALSFVILTIFVIAMRERIEDLNEEKEFIMLHDIGYKVQSELFLAHNSINGYSRIFMIPEDIDGMEYTIYVTADKYFVVLNSETHEASLPIPDFQGTINKGANKITKINEVVFIE